MASKFNTSSFSAALQAAAAAAQTGGSSSDSVSNSFSGLIELNLMQLRELQIISTVLAQIAGISDSDLTAMRGDPGILL